MEMKAGMKVVEFRMGAKVIMRVWKEGGMKVEMKVVGEGWWWE